MRRLLGFIAAGMAACASASLEPDWPVRLSLFIGGPEIQAYERAGELLVRPDELRVLGLSVQVDGPLAQVSRGESTVRAPLHPQHGKLSLVALAEALGLHLVRPEAEKPATAMLSTVRRVFADPTGFGFESTHPVTVKSFTLKEPDRLVVDLKGARLDPNASMELTPPARASQFQADTVRIVLETEWRVRGGLPETSSCGAWMLEDPSVPPIEEEPGERPSDPQPAKPRIGPIVAVRSGPREETFELRLPAALANQVRLEREAPERIAIRLPACEWIAPDKPLPSIRLMESEAGAAQTVVRLHLDRPMVVRSVLEQGALRFTLHRPEVGDGKLAGKVVVVDAGHGGQDSGAKAPGGGTMEKDLNLAMALEIAAQLSRNGADVILTRASDVFLPLKERSEIANRARASFFISVHVNSNRVANSRSGTMVFHHKTDPVGQLLADCIQREIGKVSGLPNLGTWSDGRIYASGFAVLRYATMPAVLLELGFINHGADLRRIRTEDFRKKVASAVVRGLRVFLGDGQPERR